ncbi:hypothetical protein ACHAPT_002205 [Fusarium lateritium]
MDSQRSPPEKTSARGGQDEDWMSWLPEHETEYLGATTGLDGALDNLGSTTIPSSSVNPATHGNAAIDEIFTSHPNTLHLPSDPWQRCSKYGPVLQYPDGRIHCVFCNQPDPLPEHHEIHNYSACVTQPGEARQFHRKDHLRQHLRLFHRGCSFNDAMKNWLSSIDDVKSRCGFCDARMDTWAERQKHLAVHFRGGSDMSEWKGDRGFEQRIDDLVENDMPVFLIGTQRRTMEPFSASRADHRMEVSDQNVFGPLSSDEVSPGVAESASPNRDETSAHSHRQIERLLLRYVSEEISKGRVPSDRQLQRRTSEMMYGPDNAWDQTWADNPQWLEMFRRKAGLISLPLSGGKNAFVGFDEI